MLQLFLLFVIAAIQLINIVHGGYVKVYFKKYHISECLHFCLSKQIKIYWKYFNFFILSKDITGPGKTDGVFAMYGADLGIARWDAARNATAVMFGDNFEFRYLSGEWRSPSIIM